MSDTRDTRDMRDDTRRDEVRREEMRRDEMRRDEKTRSDMPRDRQAPPVATEPVRRGPVDKVQPAQMEIWPDMSSFHSRFEEIQSEFIEDPKAAVSKAEKLVEEAIDQMAKLMHERMHSMHRDIEGKDGDTETLRQTMRGYRMWIESVGHRHAA